MADTQHLEALTKTIHVTREVTATLHDDKVREMGGIVVAKGKITITLLSVPSMMTAEATADLLADEIRLAVRECYLRDPEAFSPY